MAQTQNATRLSSPEQLNDYLRVTNPKVWVLLLAVVLLLVGLLLWSTCAVIESSVTGTARVANGQAVALFENREDGEKVQAGMTMEVGGSRAEIDSVGTDVNGKIIASAKVNVPNGTYEARVGYRATQVISMLLN
ncbi:MAG: hypothetical protein E7000_05240 [Coriobacteriaceae bacterium]|nr:hypothetical protein [Coriobacteriaceae bacterium]